ncbi:MAG: hypothetical protein ACR2RE_08855 [Geminicoccaceae bacterium]
MSKVLDTYDPNGEELWGYHLGIARELMRKIIHLEWARQPIPKELYLLLDEHNQAWRKAELSRYRTLKDYLQFHWSFLIADAERKGIPFSIPTFDDGATIENAAALYPHYKEKIEHAIRTKHDKLPEGRPNGLDIFEPGEGRIVTSEFRRFEWHTFDAEVVTLVSYDLRPSESHICLSFVPGEVGGATAMVRFEGIINSLYREALAQAYHVLEDRFCLEMMNIKIMEVLKVGIKALKYPIVGLIPNNMRFYLYVPAEFSHQAQPTAEFDHVPLIYRAPKLMEHGHFREASFEPLDRVPPYIKHARYIEGLAMPSSQPSGVFYRRAAMLLGETPSQPSLQG